MRKLAPLTRRLLFFALFLVVESGDQINEFYPNERDALLQLRDSVKSSVFDLHSHWTGPPCYKNLSNWAGILCSDGHVIHLVLEEIQLTGSLPPTFLEQITFLKKLSFRNNFLYGSLPNLTGLVYLEFVLLSDNRFSGSIPEGYIELQNLTELELQGNDIEGSIPPFDQQSLIVFNVSSNKLEGPIPETSVLQRFPRSCYGNNSNLCGGIIGIPCPIPPFSPPKSPIPYISPPSPGEKKKNGLKVWSIALIAAAAALVPLSIMFILLGYFRRSKRKETQGEHKEGNISNENVKKRRYWSESTEDPERTLELEFFDKDTSVFDMDDLLRASAEVLGKGKLSTTYKAILESGVVVAVKRLKEMNSLSKKEFIQQMQLLGKLRHENLVEMISFYYSKEEKLIVYEYVPYGDLFELLHENRGIGRQPLNWTARISIIKDVAKALNFLHQSLPSHKVPHGNIRSKNVLIQQDPNNKNYHSKLTDYGFLPLLQSKESSKKLAVGKSPEFCQGKKLTRKADIYCFGILLLEVITGKIPGELFSPENGVTSIADDDLSEWVRTVVNNDWSTDILDMEILAQKEGYNEMLKLTELALECTDEVPEKRPKMSQVFRRIEEIEVEQKRSVNDVEDDSVS
ncbi:PREDICTED: probable leucine-rich repeat receptor-like protein kinase At1g68400 [Nicotiana attenuata]|uniref:Inactive receptor kinase n=1 Tax=Nicotiana attenuata TaxID=49451 RepID=A0A314KIR6_NICAT|nr:PREDICTED: probable leucine-rich repeat receptor-like protein kinase At1g68400 [Nicotiana attenuata]OIT29266.1 putative inactive receptor kinase [Nicotiana attenuata]